MEWDRAKESVCWIVSVNSPKKKKIPKPQTRRENRSQQENVSSSVWIEVKNRVEKTKNNHCKISHNLAKKNLNRGRLVWGNICKSKNNSEVLQKDFPYFGKALKKTSMKTSATRWPSYKSLRSRTHITTRPKERSRAKEKHWRGMQAQLGYTCPP